MLLLQRLQFYLAATCHQAKVKLARVAAPLQLRYPDLKECEALARLGLRYTDTVRGRLDYILFAISVICHIAYYIWQRTLLRDICIVRGRLAIA